MPYPRILERCQIPYGHYLQEVSVLNRSVTWVTLRFQEILQFTVHMQGFEVEWKLVQPQNQSNSYITEEEFISPKEWKISNVLQELM
jgi:hypothetical protein